jgi:L-threonylcarbamoyladenylate synthase
VGIESTIVTEEKGEIVICRLGGVSVEEIEAVVGRVGFSLNKSSNPNAPGQLKSHYSPLKPMELGDVNELLVKHQNRKVAVLSFYSAFNRSNIVKSLWLSESGSYEEAARNLFAYLRILDQCEADIILAERLPETFLGRAINDRLNRAAAEK